MSGPKLMTNVLLDTNVIIYSIDRQSKYFNAAQNLINDPGINLFTTSKNIAAFLTVVTRLPDHSLSIKQAITVITDYQKISTILYPTEKSLSIFLKLVNEYKPIGLAIHDFEIVSIGLAHKIDQIATFNQKDFKKINEITFYPFIA